MRGKRYYIESSAACVFHSGNLCIFLCQWNKQLRSKTTNTFNQLHTLRLQLFIIQELVTQMKGKLFITEQRATSAQFSQKRLYVDRNTERRRNQFI